MPPSPRIEVHIDNEKLAALLKAMELSDPPTIAFRDRLPRGAKLSYSFNGSASVFGTYSPAGHAISIYTEQKQYGFDRIRAVNAELVITLLHELRHAWQHRSPGWTHGNVAKDERDAEDFAQANYHKWRGVIQLRRQTFHKKLPG